MKVIPRNANVSENSGGDCLFNVHASTIVLTLSLFISANKEHSPTCKLRKFATLYNYGITGPNNETLLAR